MVVARGVNCRPWGKIDSPFRTRYYRSEIFSQVDKTSGAMKGRRESPNTHTHALTGKKREIQVKVWGKFCVSSNNTRAIRRTHWNFQTRTTFRMILHFPLQALERTVVYYHLESMSTYSPWFSSAIPDKMNQRPNRLLYSAYDLWSIIMLQRIPGE